MKFPSIKDVAAGLRDINANVEASCDDPHHEQPCGCAGCDVRLCVWSDGQWCLRSGDVQYDQSHSDYCGASSVPGVVAGKVKRFDSMWCARYLLDECKEQRAMSGDDNG